MKRSAFAILICISMHASAQNESAFYTRDSAGISRIADMVMANTKNKYNFDKTRAEKWDVMLRYLFGKYDDINIHFKMQPDRSAMLKSVSGLYEDIFPFWKKYFQPDADMETLRKARGARLFSPFLNGTGAFFFKMINSNMCQIEIGYKPDPVKPVKPVKPATGT